MKKLITMTTISLCLALAVGSITSTTIIPAAAAVLGFK
jgi:hypothetical protein